MTDWADEKAAMVDGDHAAIAAALRTERELGRQIEADLRAELARWQRIAIDRLKTIKGMQRKMRAR